MTNPPLREAPLKVYLSFYVTGEEDEVARTVTYVKESWLERLEAIERAATNLVNVKGRHHTELAMKALVEAVKIPHF